MARAFILVMVFLSVPAAAKEQDNFTPCSKSTDCRSKRCASHVCKPSSWWHPKGGQGARCESGSDCASGSCKINKCEGPKPVAKKAGGTQRSTGGSSAPTPETAAEPQEEIVYDDRTDPIRLDDCAADIRATVTDGQFADHQARDLCNKYSTLTLSRAKQLTKRLGINFGTALERANGVPPEVLQCSKEAYLNGPESERKIGRFVIKGECFKVRSGIELDECGKLAAAALPAMPEDMKKTWARSLCNRYSSETIGAAKAILEAGYRGDLESFAFEVEGQSQAAIDCALKAMESAYGKSSKLFMFRVNKPCREGELAMARQEGSASLEPGVETSLPDEVAESELPKTTARNSKMMSIPAAVLKTGTPLPVTFLEPMTAKPGEKFWITIVPATSDVAAYVGYQYLKPDAKEIKLSVPAVAADYEVRLHGNYPTQRTNLIDRLRFRATSKDPATEPDPGFPDDSAPAPTAAPEPPDPGAASKLMSLQKARLDAKATFTVTFPKLLKATEGKYWVAIAAPGSADSAYLTYDWVETGKKTIELTAPETGTYELRLHANYPRKKLNVIDRLSFTVR